MSRRHFPLLIMAPAAILITALSRLMAQEPADDPFAGEARTEAPAPAAPAEKKATPVDEETDPNVLAIRSANPSTPQQLMTAVEQLMNFGRPDEAKKYLKRLTDAGLDEATLWGLQRKFGSGFFIRLSTDAGMAPEGRPFAEAVLNAAHNAVRNPARLDALIQQLSGGSSIERQVALSELKSAGEDAAVAMIGVLGDASRAAEHRAVRQGLVQLGEGAKGPVLATLESSNEPLRAQLLSVAADLDLRDAMPFLLRPALIGPADSDSSKVANAILKSRLSRMPSRPAAEHFLHREAVAFFGGRLPGKPDHEDLVTRWTWNQEQQRPVVQRVPKRTASLHAASRLASELTQLAPENRAYRRLYVTALLESAKLAGGWETPLARDEGSPFAIAAAIGPSELEQVIDDALAHGHSAAAVGALEVLGEVGDVRLLDTVSGRPRTLINALQNADRRVRFAALQAIRQINPRQPYAGASYVPEAIGYFIRVSESHRVLIAHPRAEHSQTIIGLLMEMGIEADRVAFATDAMQRANQNSAYEFVLLSDALDRPDVGELWQQLRREPRTKHLPIGILAREDRFTRLEQMVEDDPLAAVFPFANDRETVTYMVNRLRDLSREELVSPEERLNQAIFAIDFLAMLAESPQHYGFYDLINQQQAVEAALNTPSLTVAATRVLGLLSTPRAQQTLVNLASQNDYPLSTRQAALAGFATAVERRGLLLTTDEILVQYDRYNLSATLDEDTQQVLGAILDTIEAPSKKRSQ